MGIRGELYSSRLSCEGRTYFFNVKENRMGDIYLNIVESKPTESESFDRRSIVVFREDLRSFLKSFQGVLDQLEKAAPQSPESRVRSQRLPSGFAGFEGGPKGLAADAAAPDKAPAPGGDKPKRRVVLRRKTENE